ncbi:MAG: LON peptidase substrate-binding domain-containing protein [Paracoccus sp. (in: a-proteobacteria)]|uniref:LON peptidase substrate-binding domain-containing protein n=1 Tax=Paracoccus sp. TaxID=267 RepID=UPI0026DEB7C9|nr:LON peptidase substrate-binding domain-containing protein [Paracoccus sp. (in: a-proteobacteria)]MDO5612627.1 LON peptidase substrate-binding domain-containing protein [Paracoccus sp. (in: a-proteobacteria)]
MPQRFDLPEWLPLFPLPGVLLLPRARLPLQIYEPRYLQMLDDVLKADNRLIGVIQPSGEDELAPIGCAGRVTGFTETEDGRYMISLRGVSRFRLTDADEGFAPYLKGRADWSDYAHDTGPAETDPGFDRASLIDRLRRLMDQHEMSADWNSMAEAGDETLVNALSMALPFEASEKQALLEAPTLPERRKMLSSLIEFALHDSGKEERLQ